MKQAREWISGALEFAGLLIFVAGLAATLAAVLPTA